MTKELERVNMLQIALQTHIDKGYYQYYAVELGKQDTEIVIKALQTYKEKLRTENRPDTSDNQDENEVYVDIPGFGTLKL